MTALPPAAASPEPARWKALLVLLSASALPHAAALWPGASYYFRDFSLTFYPLHLFQARELRAGRWPSWNPYLQEGTFAPPMVYPPDLLHSLWPGPATLSWLLTLHVPLAALCAYLLARDLGARRHGAVFAGLLYALGGFAASSLNLYVFLQALSVAPALVLTLRRAAVLGGRWLAAGALAVAVSMATLAVEFAAQAVALGLALGLAAHRSPRALLRMAVALALGVGLAALPLALVLGVVGETVRGAGFGREVALANDVHPVAFLQVLVPDLFGSLSAPVERWWGGHFFSKGFPYFLSLYLGVIPAVLAIVGWPVLDRRTRVALGACALLGVWYALGVRGGLAPALSWIPALRWFRFPVKALLTPYLAAALLAGLGFDRLRGGDGWRAVKRWSPLMGALAIAPAAAVLVAPRLLETWAGVPSWGQRMVLAESLEAAALGVVAALMAVAVVRGRLPGALAALMLAVLATAELARAAAGMNPQVPARFYEPLPEMSALHLQDEGRVFSYGIEHSPAFRRFMGGDVRGLGLWSFFINRQMLGPYTNVLDGVETAAAKDLTSWVTHPTELGDEDYDPRAVGAILDGLRDAAVAHVLSLDPLAHPDLTERAVVPTGQAPLAIHVYRLERSWPRAYAACRVLLAPERAAALTLPLAAGFDPGRDVVLEAAWPSAAEAPCRSGAVRRLAAAPGQDDYEATLDGDGFLVTRDSFARGWRAWVDGRPAPVLRANGKHRAVPLGPGSHHVRLQYRPPGLPAALVATACATLAVLLIGAGMVGGRGR